MAIKSTNVKGNPYHDESTGEFTSAGKSGLKNIELENKIAKAMGVTSANGLFRKVDKNLQREVPQYNLDGSKRIFVNELAPEKKMLYLRHLQNLQEEDKHIKPLTDNDSDTWDIQTPERKAFREQKVQEEIQKQLETPKKFQKRAFLILGLPASGKSTLADYLKKEEGAFDVDSDYFTKVIPEFVNDPSQIAMVHREAGKMAKEMTNQIASQGGNMVIGKVGGGYDISYLEKYLDDLAAKGYGVQIILNDLPVEEGIKRNAIRHKNGEPRLVPASVSFVADATIHRNFEKLLKHKSVVGGSVYSNDVPMGEKPKLIKKY